MIISATFLLASLSADVRRQSYLVTYYHPFDNHETQFKKERHPSYTELYDYSKRKEIIEQLQGQQINNSVKNNAITLLEGLSTIFIDGFNRDDLYTSSYGTIVLEFNLENSIFTIEIGQKSFGYFSEINGHLRHMVEEQPLVSGASLDSTAIGNLNKHFFEFYNL